MKELLLSPAYVKPFDITWDTYIFVDSSKTEGAGYIMVQVPPGQSIHQVGGLFHVVRCGSILPRKSWENLSPVEFEAAGAQWAVEHTKLYIRGSDKPTTLVVDHKPLIGLFRKTWQTFPTACLPSGRACWTSTSV